ncbi:MAG: Trk family potassium uptake protein [Chloroflexi bacterium]|nr:Trk family potassium uptake protein [Chloroflexota bacterium]MDA1002284.1 Trk family potassium uptake protein [Chloroflexota bacterium]
MQAVRAARPVRASSYYLLGGFAILITVGTLLLWLPVSARSEEGASFTTALFTATSAVCVTGLVVVDTHDFWSPFGQVVILLLIQLGGLGFMASATLLILIFGGRLSMRQRLLASETLGRLGVERVGQLIRRIILTTLAIEAVGVALLLAALSFADHALTPYHVWRALFLTVSAFNNAGFDIEGGFRSISAYRGNIPMLAVTGTLVVLGGTGFAVWSDVVRRRNWRRFTLDTKLVIVTSLALWIAGAIVIMTLESQRSGVLVGATLRVQIADALWMSVVARTAGFAIVDFSAVDSATLFFTAGLMFIGGASASTAGGIKLTTFSSLFFAILASLRGEEHVNVFGREISWHQVNRALAIALLSVAGVFALSFALSVSTDNPFDGVLFESVSALGTVGLSTGGTPDFGPVGRILLILGMFIGRLGPLTIGLALAGRLRATRVRYAEETISIG